MTLMSGDPSYAGPLTGVALGIPSYYVLEPAILAPIPQPVFERELALLSAVIGDSQELVTPLRSPRGDAIGYRVAVTRSIRPIGGTDETRNIRTRPSGWPAHTHGGWG
jgi:hypothetical protein